jgi:hypothetical protein
MLALSYGIMLCGFISTAVSHFNPPKVICITGGVPAPDSPSPPVLRAVRRPLPPLCRPVGLRISGSQAATADVQQHISARQHRGPSPSQGRRQPSRWRYGSIAKRHRAQERLLRTTSQVLDVELFLSSSRNTVRLPLLEVNPHHYRREERQHWNE